MASRRTASPVREFTAQSALVELDFAGLDELFGYRLRRAQGAVHRHYLATLDELKLTQKQTAVLWLVTSNPGVAQGAIGSALGMDRATTMALVDRLEERGLLQRSRSRIDARRRELRATAAGRRVVEQAREKITRHEAQVKCLFSARELRTLRHFLQRMQELETSINQVRSA
jgi:MarR family transcriptional regulator, organic hydroperoxide resistance regulator